MSAWPTEAFRALVLAYQSGDESAALDIVRDQGSAPVPRQAALTALLRDDALHYDVFDAMLWTREVWCRALEYEGLSREAASGTNGRIRERL